MSDYPTGDFWRHSNTGILTIPEPPKRPQWIVAFDTMPTDETVAGIRRALNAAGGAHRTILLAPGVHLYDVETGCEYPSEPLEPVRGLDLRWLAIAFSVCGAICALIGYALGLAA